MAVIDPPELRRLLNFWEALPHCPHGCDNSGVYEAPTFRTPTSEDTIDDQVSEIISRYEREADGQLQRHLAEEHDERENLLCHLYKVLCEDMPSCGCGDPQASHTLVHGLLRLAPLFEDGRWRDAEKLIGTDGAVQIVLSALTEAGLMEHGSSVGGSWITDKGRWVLWAIDHSGGIDGLDERLDLAGAPHWDEEAGKVRECTQECWRAPETMLPADMRAAGIRIVWEEGE